MWAHLRIPFELGMVGVGIGEVVVGSEGSEGWIAGGYHSGGWLVVGEEVVQLVGPAQHIR